MDRGVSRRGQGGKVVAFARIAEFCQTDPMSSGDDLDFGHFRAALERERAEILNLSDQSEDERKPVELDQQSVGRLSRMDALQVQAMAKALDSRRQGRLMQIEAALQRIESGDYGICEGCDDEIPPKRLEIDPAARRCVNCAGV
tara:strand:- start:845 stop:1276 length:432 start_codon:yes stop_codon:yes gene_type:complete